MMTSLTSRYSMTTSTVSQSVTVSVAVLSQYKGNALTALKITVTKTTTVYPSMTTLTRSPLKELESIR